MSRDEADRAFHALFNAIDYAMKAADEWPDVVLEHDEGIAIAIGDLEDIRMALAETRVSSGQFGMGA